AAFKSAGGDWVSQMATFITTNSLITLPINLLSFTGQCNNDHIVLDWTTASEMNNDYFAIERNDDGTTWKPAGTVKSAGNSSTAQKYSLTTDKANSASSYFRLKQTDVDGNTKYFNTIQVNNCHTDQVGISIYPNPTNGVSLFGRIDLKANEVYSIVIYDTFGRMISSSTSNQPEFTVNFPHTLASGVYYAKFSSEGFSKAACFLVKH
ncbi:MAG TPA: T9SS type A sorting domain-containing protein, partial [Puia sp.]